MADKTQKIQADDGTVLSVKYQDLGDGTYAAGLSTANQAVITRASATQVAGTYDSGILANLSGKSIHVTFDVTVPNGGSAVLSIYGYDVASTKNYLLLAGAAVSTAVTNVYKVGPGLPVAANVSANDLVPRQFRIQVVVSTATMTFSVGHQLG